MDPSIRALFAPEPGSTYLDSATYGLPPEPTLRVMREALDAWTPARANWIEDWDKAGERGRAAFGALMGIGASRVALIPATSVGVGVVAAALTAEDDVVVTGDEFTSVLFPLLVARDRGVPVREVEFERLVDSITPGTTLVACSLVQMQTGRNAPIRAIVERAAEVGARVLLDATQGIPFVPLGDLVDRIDYLVCSAYKHLLCPRGVAFMAIRPRPRRAAGADPRQLAGGRPPVRPLLRRALDARARRRDVRRLARLAALARSGRVARAARPLAGGRRARGADAPGPRPRRGLGLPWGGSSLVSVPIDDADAAREALAIARIRAAFRGTGIRLSPHVYNDAADVARAIEALAPVVAG